MSLGSYSTLWIVFPMPLKPTLRRTSDIQLTKTFMVQTPYSFNDNDTEWTCLLDSVIVIEADLTAYTCIIVT